MCIFTKDVWWFWFLRWTAGWFFLSDFWNILSFFGFCVVKSSIELFSLSSKSSRSINMPWSSQWPPNTSLLSSRESFIILKSSQKRSAIERLSRVVLSGLTSPTSRTKLTGYFSSTVKFQGESNKSMLWAFNCLKIWFCLSIVFLSCSRVSLIGWMFLTCLYNSHLMIAFCLQCFFKVQLWAQSFWLLYLNNQSFLLLHLWSNCTNN